MLRHKEERNLEIRSATSIAAIILLSINIISLVISVEPVMALPPENETPLKLATVVFEPYFFVGEDTGSGNVIDASNLHGYSVTLYREETASTNPMNTTLIHFYNICIGGDYGIVFISTHGSEFGFAVEAYEMSDAGKSARDAQYDEYIGQGFTAEEIYKASSDHGWHISIYSHALQSWFVDAKTIVYLISCDATFGSSWGAREVLTYNGSVSSSKAKSDANLFWGHMDGTIDGGTKRSVSKAIEGTNLTHTGLGNTVLSPKVESHGFSSVMFDCRMDTTVPPQQVVTAMGAILTNMEWVGDDAITFSFNFTDINTTFTVHADKAISGNNGAELDGNQNPSGTNGVGPNGDDYVFNQTKPTSVGGIGIPVDKFALLAPYIRLTVLLGVAVVTLVYVKKRKRNTEINS